MKKYLRKLKQGIIISLIPVVVIVSFLAISTHDKPDNPKLTTATITPSSSTQPELKPENQNIEQDIQPTNNYTSLIIDPDRCRGCGRCASIDQEHFTMNGNVAQVISETNLDSKNITSAISACPGNAINLS